MILLGASASHLLRVVTPGTGNLLVHASWVDKISATDVTPGITNTPDITTATTTTVVAGNASAQRNVQMFSAKNTHATTARTLTVDLTDGTTAVPLTPAVALAAGETLVYEDGFGWYVLDITCTRRAVGLSTGRFLKSTLLISGTSFVTTALTGKIKVSVQAGGGGGGGCTSVAAAAAAAGGGGGGGYAEKTWDVLPNTAYAYTIGAAGNGASGAVGGTGGNSTFVGPGAVTVTAFGGVGGPVATAATTLTARAGGAGGAVSTNGDVNSGGEPGEYGVVLIVATPIVAAGGGGASVYGGAGAGIVAVGNGVNATGFGAGGGGSATGASVVRTGGNGTGGCIVVDEFAA